MNLDAIYLDRPEDFRVDLRKAEQLRATTEGLQDMTLAQVLRVMNYRPDGDRG